MRRLTQRFFPTGTITYVPLLLIIQIKALFQGTLLSGFLIHRLLQAMTTTMTTEGAGEEVRAVHRAGAEVHQDQVREIRRPSRQKNLLKTRRKTTIPADNETIVLVPEKNETKKNETETETIVPPVPVTDEGKGSSFWNWFLWVLVAIVVLVILAVSLRRRNARKKTR